LDYSGLLLYYLSCFISIIEYKGYSSKSHLATLCALINLYCKEPKEGDGEEKKLSKEDIELVAKISLDKEEVTYFVEAKNKRETASYGISGEFTKSEAENIKIKTVLFVNKVKEILENQ